MNYGMSQSMELRQSQQMLMSAEMRLALDQKLVQLMETMEDAFPPEGEKKEMLKKILMMAVETIGNDKIRQGLSGLIDGDKFPELVLRNVDVLFSGRPGVIEDLALQYVYEMHNGLFEKKNTKGETEEIIKDVNLSAFIDAYHKPEYIKEEIQREKDILETVEEKSGLIEEIRKYQQSLDLVEPIRQDLDTIISLVNLALNQRFGGQKENALDFINETALLSKFRLFESERLAKRFINRCDDVGVTHLPEKHKVAFLNTLGEFVLISFGVISPNVFVLKQGNIDGDIEDSLRQFTEEAGLNFDQVMTKYNLTKRGGFFYQRWAILGQKPSAITDDNVRNFIINTVRKDGEELLKAAKFEDLIGRIKQIKKDTPDKGEREEEFHELFDDLFSNPEFMNTLLKHAGGWYKELKAFYLN